MRFLVRFKKVLKDPNYVIGKWMKQHHPRWMCDRWYLKIMWWQWMGYKLDLKHPRTFNEKLQWLKLYDRKPEYTLMADKFRVKEWVSGMIGEEYVIPTLVRWDSAKDISIDSLPNRFVLKCNHDSGSTIVCRDKTTFDLDDAKEKLETALEQNYYWTSREWPYKKIKRCILAEQFVENENEGPHAAISDLISYKFMCFDGEPRLMYLTVKNDDIWEDYFDMDFKPLKLKRWYRNSGMDFKKPDNWEKMIEIARVLSKDTRFLRVDLYEINGKVYFSECTFYDWAGFCKIDPKEWDLRMGSWIKLPGE